MPRNINRNISSTPATHTGGAKRASLGKHSATVGNASSGGKSRKATSKYQFSPIGQQIKLFFQIKVKGLLNREASLSKNYNKLIGKALQDLRDAITDGQRGKLELGKLEYLMKNMPKGQVIHLSGALARELDRNPMLLANFDRVLESTGRTSSCKTNEQIRAEHNPTPKKPEPSEAEKQQAKIKEESQQAAVDDAVDRLQAQLDQPSISEATVERDLPPIPQEEESPLPPTPDEPQEKASSENSLADQLKGVKLKKTSTSEVPEETSPQEKASLSDLEKKLMARREVIADDVDDNEPMDDFDFATSSRKEKPSAKKVEPKDTERTEKSSEPKVAKELKFKGQAVEGSFADQLKAAKLKKAAPQETPKTQEKTGGTIKDALSQRLDKMAPKEDTTGTQEDDKDWE